MSKILPFHSLKRVKGSLFVMFLAFLLMIVPFLYPTKVYADRTIDSATLNGSSSVTVSPSATITATVTVTTTGSSNNWRATTWQIGSGAITCVDHANYGSSGTYTETFDITAPSSNGVYDVSFVAYGGNNCRPGASNTYTLTTAVTVTTSTPTPTPTPTPSSTPTPSGTATPTPSGTATPTPSGSSTPTPSSSSESSSSTTYYPSVSLDTTYSTVQQSSLSFSGSASVDNGTIYTVEYSTDNGNTWQTANATDGAFDSSPEAFNFTLKNLELTTYTVLVRAESQALVYTQSSNYASNTFLVSVINPKVTLNAITPNPTKDTTPTFTGNVTNGTFGVDSVQLSFNGGKSWQKIANGPGSFSFTSQLLSDGNYDMIARAIDTEGNVGVSDTQTLVVDVLNPLIGGSFVSVGSQYVIPQSGAVQGVVGADINYTLSTKGGVTDLSTEINGKNFKFDEISKELWQASLVFDQPGTYTLDLRAEDGAGNVENKTTDPIVIESQGEIMNKTTSEKIKDVTITLYYYNNQIRDWTVWDAASFGQTNPVDSVDGTYSYLVPPGKYYLSIKKGGYKPANSEIIDVEASSIINSDFSLSQNPGFTIKLPIIGKVELRIPNFIPDSLPVKAKVASATQIPTKGIEKIDFNTDTYSLSLSSNKSIASQEGTRTLVAFVSTWSPLSQQEISTLNDTYGSLPEADKIVVVFVQQSSGEVQSFLNRGGYNFNALVDEKGLSLKDTTVNILPLNIFIDSSGKISVADQGPMTKEKILETFLNLE